MLNCLLLFKELESTIAKPCLGLGGLDSLRILTTSGYENHSGIGPPLLKRFLSSVPLMLRVEVVDSQFGQLGRNGLLQAGMSPF